MLSKPVTCKGCPMESIGSGYAPPSGPRDANLLFIGEALGEEEARIGKPFVGGSGRILNSLLLGAGLSRDRIRVDNAMRCRPPKNKIPPKFDPKTCAERHLFTEIKEMRPNCMVLLGSTALKVVAGMEGITKMRGSIVKTPHGKAMCTLHPAKLMRQQTMFPVVGADIKRSIIQGFTPDMPHLPDKFILEPTLQDVKDFCTRPHSQFSIDIESTTEGYQSCALIMISFFDGAETLCIPWLKRGGREYWPQEEQIQVIQLLYRLLAGPEKKCFQNGMFDVTVLEEFGFKINNWVFDTMLAHHLLYAEMSHKLEFIGSVHSNVPYYKDESKGDFGFLALPDETARGYNCKDSMATGISWWDLEHILKTKSLWDFFQEVTMKLPRILIRMKRRGLLVDRKVLSEAVVKYTEVSWGFREELKKLGVVNPTSLNYLKTLFFETYSLPVLKKTKKQNASLDEDTLNKLQVHCYDVAAVAKMPIIKELMDKASKVITLILKLRKNDKVLSTYLRNLPIGPDGKVHPNWLIHGTRTGRLSSRDPNGQNVPPGIAREIYVAEPGSVIVSFDYSQIELVLVAYMANEERLIQAFAEGRDVHSENAALLFHGKVIKIWKGKEPEWITKAQRDFAKSFAYALNYGGDIFSVMTAHPGMITTANGKVAQGLYYATYPGIENFRKGIRGEVLRTRTLVSPFGRPRIFFGSTSEILNSAYNFPIQAGAAEVINKAMIRLAKKKFRHIVADNYVVDEGEEGTPLDDGLRLQIHDQLLYILKESRELPARVTAIKEEMSKPVTVNGRTVNLKVDITTGYSWGKLTEWKSEKYLPA